MSNQVTLTEQESVDFLYELGKDGWYLYSAMRVLSDGEQLKITQTGLSKRIGVSLRYLQRHLPELEEFKVKGKPLLETTKVSGGKLYSILDVQFTRNSDSEVAATKKPKKKQKVEKPKLPTDEVFKYFCEKYQDQYGVEYKVTNFAREKGGINKLIRQYKEDVPLLKAIIDVVIRLYESKWRSGSFTRPTIGAMVSWLAREAEPIAQANMEAEATAHIVITSEDDGEDLFSEHDKKWGL
ncbi:hypothetical protein ACS2BX_25645 [Bacillus cereus group sp. BceL300]|uniref:hypothetical protein n=1 Tax=Bacillus cereus group TaxID=86661 RepID=UPI0014444CA7|nr:hypothetical protein [Bacillus cereus]NKW77458.1 hypothetical protein [Bacillus cereus]NKX14784.1 hypothetical protein [Bacillus cereus]HDR8003399.1 hypothetical protein [Bacillus cereus]HDR8014945.1 hypothetical protein [Bacillus cereus]